MAFEKLKRLRSLLKEYRRQADDILTEYKAFLSPGIWKSPDGLVSFYRRGYRRFAGVERSFIRLAWTTGKGDFSGTERLAKVLFLIFYKFKKRSDSASSPTGQVLTLNSHETAAKLVNPVERYLITVYKSQEKMQDYLSKRDLWVAACGGGYCFSVPPILESNLERRYIKEKFLKKSSFSAEDGFRAIIADYLKCFAWIGKNSTQGTITKEQGEKLLSIAGQLGLSDLGDRALSFMRSADYRFNLSHGDLFPLNLICSEGKYYYIDFEIVGQRVFFFDWFKYITGSYAKYGAGLLHAYLNGEYDEAFRELFRLNGVAYHAGDREVYLFVYEMLSTDFGFFSPFWDYREVWKEKI